MNKTLREYLTAAKPIGHFNISNLEGLWAVFRAAKELNAPVIIGVSEGERDFIGVRQIVALIKSLREEFDYPIFLNADHSYTFERVQEAIDTGFDAVIFDGAKLSLVENIKITKQCVEYARKKNPTILVEGELGYIGQSSKLLEKIPEGVNLNPEALTKPEEAKKFVQETGVDLLAPAVGNIHGMLRNQSEPKLDLERIKAIRQTADVPLVLHGGSGNSEADLKAAIAAGVSIVHISTELRVAYRDALQDSLANNPDEVAPYKFLQPAVAAMQAVVANKLRLFNNES